jgi:3'(2'), 5'-bisphosphate nucleotidase
MTTDPYCLAANAVLEAGRRILTIYGRDFTATEKEDRSPLTEADLAAHAVLVDALAATGLPVLSEESREVPYAERAGWSRFWLVDPLDGTKEFIKRNGEFTVNVALIDNGRAVFGLVLAPVLGVLYIGSPDGAWRVTAPQEPLTVIPPEGAVPLPDPALSRKPGDPLRVVASRSHLTGDTEAFIAALEEEQGKVDLVSSGSSLKLCRVAEGSAEVYPRLAPTMEWDTAAGQAVIEAAGGAVRVHPSGEPLRYNRPDLLNPFFVVTASGFEWRPGSPPSA